MYAKRNALTMNDKRNKRNKLDKHFPICWWHSKAPFVAPFGNRLIKSESGVYLNAYNCIRIRPIKMHSSETLIKTAAGKWKKVPASSTYLRFPQIQCNQSTRKRSAGRAHIGFRHIRQFHIPAAFERPVSPSLISENRFWTPLPLNHFTRYFPLLA